MEGSRVRNMVEAALNIALQCNSSTKNHLLTCELYLLNESNSSTAVFKYSSYTLYTLRREIMDQEPAHHHESLCPICLDRCRYSIETNCGHTYCAECIKQCVLLGNHDENNILCPYCRRAITTLYPMYTPEENASEEGETHLQFVSRFNTLFAPLAEETLTILRDWPVLMDHLRRDFFRPDRVTNLIRIKILLWALFAVLYVLIPLDIISETAFGILGYVDDIIIIFLITLQMTRLYRGFLLRQLHN